MSVIKNDDEASEAIEPQVPLPEPLEPPCAQDDDEPVQISMSLTRADRLRLRMLGIDLNLSLQRMGHRAWNGLLSSYGLPGLTAVYPGRQGKGSKNGGK